MNRMLHSDAGFTLIELLVVTGIIGVVSAIAMPLYSDYLGSSFEARLKSDLRHIAFAEEAYFVDYQVFKSCDEATCASILPGILTLSPGVTLSITATTTGFSGTASHPKSAVSCPWDSSQFGFLGCS